MFHSVPRESGVSDQVEGAVLVTTPQAVAVGDVRREITFCRKVGLPILGIVENMSGYVCPHCSECTNIFSSGGGAALAKHAGLPFLGSLPIEPNLAAAAESGENFIEKWGGSEACRRLLDIYSKLSGSSGGDQEIMEMS